MIHIYDNEDKVIESWESVDALYQAMNRRMILLQTKRKLDVHNAYFKGLLIGAGVVIVLHLLVFFTVKYFV